MAGKEKKLIPVSNPWPHNFWSMVHLSRKIFKMATKCRWRPRSRRSRASGRRSSRSTRSRALTTSRPSPSMKPGSRVSSNLCHVSSYISPNFFAQSACIKIASPQAARIRIFFIGKPVVWHLLEGSELRTHFWEDGKEKKAQDPAGFKPTTSLLWGMCSIAVLQLLPQQFPGL